MNNLISLSKLFDKRIFRIPDYQRGYAWQHLQLSDFWEDLWNLSEDRYHYTGMLSLKQLKSDAYKDWTEEKWLIDQNDYEAFHVVDGQQRLTTFIILVNSIVKFAEKNHIEYLNNNELSEIKTRYIVEYQRPKRILKAYKFGYEKDNPSFEYLRYNILGEEASGNLQETFYTLNLEYAKQFFDKKVAKLYEEHGEQGLETLFSKLVNRLQFNIHYIEDDFDVFVAFETMNNRGKKLSNLEILKNRLIYLTTIFPNSALSTEEKTQLRSDINSAWSEVYYELGRNKNHPLNDDEYLKNHWILYFKYSRQKGDDYIKFLLNDFFTARTVYGAKTGFEESFPNEEHQPYDVESDESNNIDVVDSEDGKLYPIEIAEYVKSLKGVAQYWYYSFNSDESPYTAEEKKWLDKLNRVGINYFRPLVVASFINKTVTPEQRVKLFISIEKFIFMCFRMARYQSTYLSHMFYRYARELMRGETTIDAIIEYTESKFEANISEATETFASKMAGYFKNYNGFYDWYDLKYFLFEYEMSLSEKTNIVRMNDWSNFTKSEKDKISIEHIFPQTPSKWYWRNQFRGYTEQEFHYLANSLGNLLPLSQSVNSSLQNDEFNSKKGGSEKRDRGYSNGSHAEQEVAKYVDWNPATILERGMKLLQYMETRWGFCFKDDVMKLSVLGLSFMSDERVIPEELPEEEIDTSTKIASATNLDELRLGYWTYAIPIIAAAHGGNGPYSGVAPSNKTYCDGFFGIGGIHLFCSIKSRSHCAVAGLWIDTGKQEKSKKMFDVLYRHKEDVEGKITMPILWDRKDKKCACSIEIALENVDFTNQDTWETIAKFHAEITKELADNIVYPYKDELLNL